MKRVAALQFADQLRNARELALRDAEAFDGIIHVIERLGSFLTGKILDLGRYEKQLEQISANSALAETVPSAFRSQLTPFSRLYEMVKDSRNDALHQGAVARTLTGHAIQLALILEDALRNHHEDSSKSPGEPLISDYMVRSPVICELWHPMGFIRQQMLLNSFSFLPVLRDKEWWFISDRDIAIYLRAEASKWRKERLADTLAEATAENEGAHSIHLSKADLLEELAPLETALNALKNMPLLVHRRKDPEVLVGIVTAFDLV